MPNEFIVVWRRTVRRRAFGVGFAAGALMFWVGVLMNGINPRTIINVFGLLVAAAGTSAMGLFIGFICYVLADVWTINVRDLEERAIAAAINKLGRLKP